MSEGQRTRRDTLLDIQYGAIFNEKNWRFYSGLKIVLAWVGFFFGSGIVYGLLKDPHFAIPSGILLAAIAAMGYSITPESRAVAFRDRYKEYVKLQGRASKLTDDELEIALFDLRAGAAPHSVSALKMPAVNDVLRANGMDAHLQPLSFCQRMFDALV
jgi:hypothetical protein